MATSTVRILFTGNSSAALRSVKQLEGGFSGLGRAGKVAASVLGVGLAGALGASVKQAISFDRSMRNVNSIAKLSEKQFQSLSKQVLALSKTTGKGPKDLADGLYDIVSSGFEAKDALTVLDASAKAATAGLTDTATATKAINAALNAYHLTAGDATKVSNVLFQTVNKGVLTFEELAQNMGDLVPAAAPLGISLEEVGAAISTITLQGVPAAEAATRVKNTFLALSKPSKALKAEFKEWGFATGEAAVKALGFDGVLQRLNATTGGSVGSTQKLFSEIRAGLGVVGLTGKNFEVYRKNLAAMNAAQKGAGATAEAFAEQSKSISFQWDKAKASLAAAAVPIGQLLFPALVKGAEGVASFAASVERNMPQIRSRFGDVANVTKDLAGGLAQVAGSREGQAVVVGLLSGVGTARGVGKFKEIVASVRALPPGLSLAAAAVGIFGAALYLTATQGDRLTESMDRVVAAIKGVTAASQNEEQAHLRVKAAQTQVEASGINLERAKQNLTRAEKDAGKGSLEYREAQLLVRQAQDQVKQSALDLRTAKQEAARAEKDHAAASKTSAETQKKTAADVTGSLRALQNVYAALPPFIRQNTDALTKQQQVAKNRVVSAYADAIRVAFVKLGGSKQYADDAADAVADLTAKLGRLPTLKEVRVALNDREVVTAADLMTRAIRNIPTSKTVSITVAIRKTGSASLPGTQFQPRAAGGFITRASGGFVPLMPGSSTGSDSVPALLTPGEVVLNKQQMRAFGGPGVFKRMFGFTGGPASHFADGGLVQQFAGGGLVAYPAAGYGLGAGAKATGVRGAGTGVGAPRPKRARGYRRLSGVAQKALAAVEAVNDRESLWERKYGQMQRGFDLTREEFIDIVSDDYGQEYEVLNQPQIDQRLGEIDKLVGQRHQMEKLIDEELDKLRVAIRDLEKAITELLAEIEREQEAARREQAEVQRLQKELGDNRREQRNNERAQARNAAEKERVSRLPEPKTQEGKAARKRYEYQLEDEGKRLDREHTRLTGEERTLEKGVTRHGSLREKHLDKARELGGTVGEFRQAKAEAAASLKGEVPLDRVDVGQEIQELQKEQTEIRAIRPAPRPMPPTDRLNAEADQLLTEMPADIDLALAMADLTDTRDDDRAALLRAQAFYTGNLGRGSLAAQASVARALKAVNDQLLSLDQPGAVTEETGGETPSAGGGTGGGAVDSAVEATLREVIAQLEKQLGLSRLTFAVQGAQQGVLGSFAKGTLHVPETGIYQLHAGEEVRSSARVSAGGGEGRGWGMPHVSVQIANGMEWLEKFVDVRVIENTDQVSRLIGREADARFRGGRLATLGVGRRG